MCTRRTEGRDYGRRKMNVLDRKLTVTFKKIALALALAVSLYYAKGVIWDTLRHIHHNHAPVTIQESATHLIGLGNEPGDMEAGCTATAIGPHVLLTAEHCDENEKYSLIRIDYSTRDYVILKTAGDGRDHILIAVDGPAFKNIAPYKTRIAIKGESTYIWGDGGGHFPARFIPGKVVDEFDPSDVNASQGMFYIDNKVIHGDSGSIIYSSDGYILGLLTYGVENKEARGAAFALYFTPDEIQFAQTFVPEEENAPLPIKKIERQNPFGIDFGR